MCLLPVCSSSFLHSALIEEVLATFTRTLIEVRGMKTFQPISPCVLHHSFTIFFWMFPLSVSLPLLFSVSLMNCFVGMAVLFVCVSVLLLFFCPQYVALSAIFPPSDSPPPPHRLVSLLSNLGRLHPQYYLERAYFIHFSRPFFSFLALSYLLRAHIVQRVIFNFRYV